MSRVSVDKGRKMLTLSWGIAGCSVAVLLVSSCAEPPPDQITSAIVGGTTDSNDQYAAVVKFEGVGGCSGTLVQRNRVLTAAHCFTNDQGDFLVRQTTVHFIAPTLGINDTAVLADVHLDPDDTWNENADLAVLHLRELAPPNIEPFTLWRRAVTACDKVWLAGFGLIDGGTKIGPMQNVRWYGSNFVDSFDGELIWLDNTDGTTGALAWHGDSGGPLFYCTPDGGVDGGCRNDLVGVTHEVSQPPDVLGNFVDVTAHRDWLWSETCAQCGNGACAEDSAPPGSIIKAAFSPAIYYYSGATKHGYVDSACYHSAECNPGYSYTCAASEFIDSIRDAPSMVCTDGSFIRPKRQNDVWRLVGGKRRPLVGYWTTSKFQALFGASWSDLVVPVCSSHLLNYAEGIPIWPPCGGRFGPCAGTNETCVSGECRPSSCGDATCNASETCSSCPRDCGVCPPTCGDAACNNGETCSSCPADCGGCVPKCGDATCNGSETCWSCPTDCGGCVPTCGDATCNGAETCSSCPADCGACPPECGDAACNGDETCASCPADCGACPPQCGDAACNGGETCSSCPADCGACPSICGDGVCAEGETCTSCPADCGACEACSSPCRPFAVTVASGMPWARVDYWGAGSGQLISSVMVGPEGGAFKAPCGACAATIDSTVSQLGLLPSGYCDLEMTGTRADFCQLATGGIGCAHDGLCAADNCSAGLASGLDACVSSAGRLYLRTGHMYLGGAPVSDDALRAGLLEADIWFDFGPFAPYTGWWFAMPLRYFATGVGYGTLPALVPAGLCPQVSGQQRHPFRIGAPRLRAGDIHDTSTYAAMSVDPNAYQAGLVAELPDQTGVLQHYLSPAVGRYPDPNRWAPVATTAHDDMYGPRLMCTP